MNRELLQGEQEKQPRSVDGHFIIVKTAFAPQLLERYLESLRHQLEITSAQAPVHIGVVDDSGPNVPQDTIIESIQRSGFENAAYVRIKEQDPTTLLARIRNEVIVHAQERGLSEIETMRTVQSYKLLLSEQFKGDWSHHDQWNRQLNADELQQEYQYAGGGNASTSNACNLLAAYMMGLQRVNPANGVFTHHDDDVVLRLLESQGGEPALADYDYVGNREQLFTNPNIHFSGGKYTGVRGSPLGVMATAYQVTYGILSGVTSYVPAHTKSPFYVFNEGKFSFEGMTVEEAYEKLPTIVNSFVSRTPITGHVLSENISRWHLDSGDIRPDQGHYSLSGEALSRLPAVPGAVPEFIMPALLRFTFPDVPFEELVGIEKPVFHHRVAKPNGGNTFTGSMIGAAFNSYASSQLAIESLAQSGDEKLLRTIASAFEIGPQDLTHLQDLAGRFYESKMRSVDHIQALWPILQREYIKLSKRLGENSAHCLSLKRLLNEGSDEVMNHVREVYDNARGDKAFLDKQARHAARYIKTLTHWPLIFDSAYRLGLRDSGAI